MGEEKKKIGVFKLLERQANNKNDRMEIDRSSVRENGLLAVEQQQKLLQQQLQQFNWRLRWRWQWR